MPTKTVAAVALGGLGALGLYFAARKMWEKRKAANAKFSIKSLTIYPVKSCGPVEMQRALIGPRGFVYDRNWVIVREDDAVFVTQREYPRMALIQVAFKHRSGG